MLAKWRKAGVKCPFWTSPAIKAVHMMTERDQVGVSWRMRWAESGRLSLEYMLTRCVERKEGTEKVRVRMM